MAHLPHSKPSSPKDKGPQQALPLPTMPTSSLAQQVQRDRIRDGLQPVGFERYANTKFLLDHMPVVGANGSPDYPPGRFAPIIHEGERERSL